MERGTWTDERLDEMAARIDSQFELLRGELAEMRTEMRQEFAAVRTEMRQEFAAVRTEMRQEFAAVRAEMHDELRDIRGDLGRTRSDMFHGAIALFGMQVAVLTVLLAQSL